LNSGDNENNGMKFKLEVQKRQFEINIARNQLLDRYVRTKEMIAELAAGF
jgi:hypothetical protein